MMYKSIFIFFLSIFCCNCSVNCFSQTPVQQFWALNQPHYIQLNGSASWQFNTNTAGIPTISGTSLTLTNNLNNEASSAFYKVKMNFNRDFTATFIYTPSGNRTGNGFAFVIQNTGVTALGSAGGWLGYSNPAITGSIALAFELYAYIGAPGIKYVTNGADLTNTGTTEIIFLFLRLCSIV